MVQSTKDTKFYTVFSLDSFVLPALGSNTWIGFLPQSIYPPTSNLYESMFMARFTCSAPGYGERDFRGPHISSRGQELDDNK